MTKFKLTMYFGREDLIKHQKGTDDYDTVKRFIENMSDGEIKDLLDSVSTATLKGIFWEKINESLRLKLEEGKEKAGIEKVIYVKMIKNEINGFLLHAILSKEDLYSKYFTKDGNILPNVLD